LIWWCKEKSIAIQRQQATGKREQSLFEKGIEPLLKPFLLKEGEVLNQGIKATENPVARSLFPVPSEATASDKREKRLNYQTIESLQEYVLVSQDEMKVEVYRRDSNDNWTVETLGKNDDLTLDSVGLTLTMADIYEDV
jgi:hypothetical protein